MKISYDQANCPLGLYSEIYSGLFHMSIIIYPHKTFRVEEMDALHPEGYIAFDGVVRAPPFRRATSANYDHHDGVSRLHALTTCEQGMADIDSGNLAGLVKGTEVIVPMIENLTDGDSATATGLFRGLRYLQIEQAKARARQFVRVEGELDRGYGYVTLEPGSLDWELAKYIAHMTEPFDQAMHDCSIKDMGASDMRDLEDRMHARLFDYLQGKGTQKDLDLRYREIIPGTKTLVVEEIGFNARIALAHKLAAGVELIASMHKKGEHTFVSIYGNAQYIPRIQKQLNALEGLIDGDAYSWGGSTVGCCSPRGVGTKLDLGAISREMKAAVR
jgi:hypothetical protein